ncbi:MAG: HEAT repeat domain-containing protein, partial [Ignavibacteriales bacterium]|nr:HEAT repeat domain-containing protein [Ignavibacteriales bacterium]
DTTYTIPSPAKPELVIFDKGNWLLKELKFEKPPEEWKFQARNATNPIDSIRALQQLSSLSESVDVITVVADRALHDPLWAVRREAVVRLGKIDAKADSSKDQIKRTLIAAYKDVKASVRDAAVSQMSKFKGADVVAFLHEALKDSSYNVMSNALRSMAKADSMNARELLRTYLDYPSFRDRVANAALSALATLDSVQVIPLAISKAKYGQPVTTRYSALGVLSKYGKGREDVLALYSSLLSDKNDGIKSTAARTLGDLGNEGIIPTLETIANDKDNSASETAKGSIEKIKKRTSGK